VSWQFNLRYNTLPATEEVACHSTIALLEEPESEVDEEVGARIFQSPTRTDL